MQHSRRNVTQGNASWPGRACLPAALIRILIIIIVLNCYFYDNICKKHQNLPLEIGEAEIEYHV